MLAFVHGPDALLVREAVRALAVDRDPSGENTTRIDARSTPTNKIAIMSGTPGFFGVGRVIIVDDLFGGKSKAARRGVSDDDEAGEAAAPKEGLAVIAAASAADPLFPFTEALFAGDAPRAVSALRDVLDRGDDVFRVLAQVMQQVELAAPLEAGLASGRGPEQVGVDLVVGNPKRMLPIAKTSRANPATPLVAIAVAADRDQKQGRLQGPDDVMEAIMIASGRRANRTGG